MQPPSSNGRSGGSDAQSFLIAPAASTTPALPATPGAPAKPPCCPRQRRRTATLRPGEGLVDEGHEGDRDGHIGEIEQAADGLREQGGKGSRRRLSGRQDQDIFEQQQRQRGGAEAEKERESVAARQAPGPAEPGVPIPERRRGKQ